MENNIGFLRFDKTTKDENILKKIKTTNNYKHVFTFIEIEDMQQVRLLDGLIIYIEKNSDYIRTFQWLIDLKDDYSLFIWILCEEECSELAKLYPQLSENSIIQVLKKDVSREILVFLIKKSLKFKNNLLNKLEDDKILTEDVYIDSFKMSLKVYDQSIMFTRKEFQIVELLYKNMGDVVPYENIYQVITDEHLDEKEGKYRVANFIFHIRNKLKKQNCLKIDIIRTKGYVLNYS